MGGSDALLYHKRGDGSQQAGTAEAESSQIALSMPVLYDRRVRKGRWDGGAVETGNLLGLGAT